MQNETGGNVMAKNQYKQGAGVCNSETDESYTPFYAVKPLLKYIPKGKIIWCPFDEEWSAYVQMFREEGYNVICSHLKTGQNFFDYEPKEHYDIIISNPPFSLADKILERLYVLGKPFVILLPLKYLQSVKRVDMFAKHGIQLLTFDKRIGYHVDQEFTKVKEGNNQATSYFCWKILPKDLIVERLDKFKRSLKKCRLK